MHVLYKNPGFEYSVDSIMEFLNPENGPFWIDSLFYFYPNLNKQELLSMSFDNRKAYITDKLLSEYRIIKNEMDDKAERYNQYFERYSDQINAALSEAFSIDTYNLFNDLTANICMNPVSPRFLQERYFEVFYKNSEKGALGVSLHEIIHYFWFYVWNTIFKDDYSDYEKPSLKWILSEMVVESIMSDDRLCSINPYYPHEQGGCVYSYFQDMKIDKQNILVTLMNLYRNNSISDYMKKSYEYCQNHEREIRKHIYESGG